MLSWKRNRVEESLGLEKKTTVSKALAESSNFGENKTELLSPTLMLRAWCIYLGLITPCPETSHLLHLPGTYHPLPRILPPPTSAWDLSPPA